jgi:hypothetical protein
MSIRWVKNVIIDGQKSTVEVQIGARHIGDKCYIRFGTETEEWFSTNSEDRDTIIAEGIKILKRRLEGKTVTDPAGRTFDWS